MLLSLKKLASGMFSRLLLNNNFEKIEDVVNNDLLHRQGDGSSVMKKDLDMDSNDILNIGEIYRTDGDVFTTKGYVDGVDAANSIADRNYTNERVQEAIANLGLDLVAGDVQTARYTYTAGQGESVVVVPFADFTTQDVFINGVHQLPNVAYTVAGNTFTFAEELQEGDKLYFLLGLALEISEYSSIDVETFTATAGQTEVTLVSSELTATEIMVFINGVKQVSSAYTFNASVITFSEALAEGDVVEVMAFTRVQQEVTEANAILLQDQVISKNTIIPAGKNGLSVDPTIAEGVTVTVSDGSTWAIVGQ